MSSVFIGAECWYEAEVIRRRSSWEEGGRKARRRRMRERKGEEEEVRRRSRGPVALAELPLGHTIWRLSIPSATESSRHHKSKTVKARELKF